MPQERPNQYGHLVPGAPQYPVKTVHFPNVLEAQARRDRRVFTCWAVAASLAGIAAGIAATTWIAERFFQ